MKVFTLFFLASLGLHLSTLFYFSVKKSGKENSHRVLLVGTKSSKIASSSPVKSTDKEIDGSGSSDGGLSEVNSDLPSIDHAVRPEYPQISRLKGEEGENHLSFKIDSSGRAYEISVLSSSGFERLDTAAIKAIQEAEFHDTNKPNHLFELRFKFVLNP